MSEHPDPELLKRLKMAVSKLPRTTREVFLEHRFDNMSYQEIADRRGLTPREVERHVAQAIYRLSTELERGPIRWWERLLRQR